MFLLLGDPAHARVHGWLERPFIIPRIQAALDPPHMKTNRPLMAVALLLLAHPLAASAAPTSEARPTGKLEVDRNLVRAGSRPVLDWNVNYPSGVDELVTINPDSSCTAKKDLRMKVRVVGVAIESGAGNHLPVALWSRTGSETWTQRFYGNRSKVVPAKVLVEKAVKKHERIDFSARAYLGNTGLDTVWTLESNYRVIALRNGEKVPSYAPAYSQGRIESFLSQYIDRNQRVTIGPCDVIYLFELGSANPNSFAFDMQDLVVVVTFN